MREALLNINSWNDLDRVSWIATKLGSVYCHPQPPLLAKLTLMARLT